MVINSSLICEIGNAVDESGVAPTYSVFVYYDQTLKDKDIAERGGFRNGEKILSYQPAGSIELRAPFVKGNMIWYVALAHDES
jgi:hypothetical protein